MRIITDPSEYKGLWKENHYSLLQSWEWGEIKRPTWNPIRLTENNIPIQILTRKIPFLNTSFGYIPRGFSKESINSQLLESLRSFSRKELKLSHLIIEPEITESEGVAFSSAGFYSKGKTIQPNQTNILPLHEGEEAVWMKMKGNYRRNIKKSKREGCLVKVFDTSDEALNRFYHIMEAIFARTTYVMYDKGYFSKVWSLLSKPHMAKIFIAVKGGVDVGAYFVAYDVHSAYELYGGVTIAGRDVEAGYLLKWAAIKDAIESNKQFYDHWGIAPVIGDDYDKNHELYHISKFKEGFGGDIVKYLPQQIVVNNSFAYMVYNLGLLINGISLGIKKRR